MARKPPVPQQGSYTVSPELRVDRVHHGADHLARGEELAAVGVLLAHLQQQVLVHLRQGEEVRVVDVVDADLVHLVEDVAQVGLASPPAPAPPPS